MVHAVLGQPALENARVLVDGLLHMIAQSMTGAQQGNI
jgi:hypothetical protein